MTLKYGGVANVLLSYRLLWHTFSAALLPTTICFPTGTYRYTVSNSVGSIQGKVTLYVTSETSGWGQQQDRRKMGLPTVTSDLVAVEQFPQFVREKSENGSKGLRDQFLVSRHTTSSLHHSLPLARFTQIFHLTC